MTRSRFIWFLVAALFLLHQDCWFWDDRRLVLGFMPIGLFYHILFSLVSAAVWAMTMKWAWPAHVEEWAAHGDEPQPPRDGGTR